MEGVGSAQRGVLNVPQRQQSPAWWHLPGIPALGSLRQEHHHKFNASLGYVRSSRPKAKKKKKKKERNQKTKLEHRMGNLTVSA